jgi:hypothetical protein
MRSPGRGGSLFYQAHVAASFQLAGCSFRELMVIPEPGTAGRPESASWKLAAAFDVKIVGSVKPGRIDRSCGISG